MIVVIDKNNIFQSPLIAKSERKSLYIKSYSHEIKEDVDGFEHPKSNYKVVLEEFGLDVIQRKGRRVENWAIMIGKHPLDIIMPVL